MGLPGDVATHMVGAGITAPYSYPERCSFTPIRTRKKCGPEVSGGDRREI